MNKIIGLIVALLMLTVPDALAQFTPQYGVRVGGELSQLRSNESQFGEFDSKVSDVKPGFTAGVFMAAPIARNFFIQPELLYVQKGGQDNFALDGPSQRDNWNIDYVEVPVLMRYDVPTQSRIVPSIYAGPYASYAVRRNVTTEMSGDKSSLDVDDVLERWDYGGTAGVDLGYRMVRNTIIFGLRYDLGVANLLQDEYSVDDATLRTGAASASIGIRFR